MQRCVCMRMVMCVTRVGMGCCYGDNRSSIGRKNAKYMPPKEGPVLCHHVLPGNVDVRERVRGAST